MFFRKFQIEADLPLLPPKKDKTSLEIEDKGTGIEILYLEKILESLLIPKGIDLGLNEKNNFHRSKG
jgi:hypothetical protein